MAIQWISKHHIEGGAYCLLPSCLCSGRDVACVFEFAAPSSLLLLRTLRAHRARSAGPAIAQVPLWGGDAPAHTVKLETIGQPGLWHGS